MKKIFSIFVNLNLNSSDTKEYFDELKFTTKFSGKITPKVTFTPVTSSFHLAEASGMHGSSHTDIHQVKLALGTPNRSFIEQMRRKRLSNRNFRAAINRAKKNSSENADRILNTGRFRAFQDVLDSGVAAPLDAHGGGMEEAAEIFSDGLSLITGLASGV